MLRTLLVLEQRTNVTTIVFAMFLGSISIGSLFGDLLPSSGIFF